MTWRWTSCRSFREKAALFAAGVLTQEETDLLRHHLSNCPGCFEYHQQMARLSGRIQKWASAAPMVECDAAFRLRWMAAIDAPNKPARTSISAILCRCDEWLWPSPYAWGALVVVWIALLTLHFNVPSLPVAVPQIAAKTIDRTASNFAQRQRELSALLESMAPAAIAARRDWPRPRSDRRAEYIAA
jgi:hypothetical protein